jgi:hypothetical protein
LHYLLQRAPSRLRAGRGFEPTRPNHSDLRLSDRQNDADKASVLLEGVAQDLRAACWVIKPADHTLPDGHLTGPLNSAG